MPTLFHKRDGRWAADRISATTGLLRFAPLRFDAAADAHGEPAGASLLACVSADGPWVLVVASDQRLTHNGQHVATGIRVLANRDSLAPDGGEAVYFSTEEVARIEPFRGAAPVTCPRCRSDVLPGQPSVRCPRCHVVLHQMADERPCWTYGPNCSACDQPTALDTGLQWTPEAL